MRRVLVARLDNAGDVLLSGPAVRAVAASGAAVTYLAGPRGAEAACLLRGVAEVLVHPAEWIDPEPPAFDRQGTEAFLRTVEAGRFDEAVILTSFHQSPLPLALLLRMAGVRRIGAISEDYAGSLLDVRHLLTDDVHEVERGLSLAAACGHRLPPGDDGRLALRIDTWAAGDACSEAWERTLPAGSYVVVHAGASVPARAPRAELLGEVVAALVEAGWAVALTGSRSEAAQVGYLLAECRRHAPRAALEEKAVNLVGRTTLASLARLLAGSAALVSGNTGPAHLAAAVGTPVVSVFAPTVPAARWHPWAVPYVLLGEQEIACRGCRARRCPLPGQPCIGPRAVGPNDVLTALEDLGVQMPSERQMVPA
jgi:ADP-heptose:LPS heptosyltransferase